MVMSLAWPITRRPPARRIAPPPAVGAYVTVALLPSVLRELQRLQDRTHLSATDLMNRAITSYEFLDAQMRANRTVLVRDHQTGEIRRVEFQ